MCFFQWDFLILWAESEIFFMRESNVPSQSEPDEFYIGYLERAPTGIAARTRAAVKTFFVALLLVAALLIAGQSDFPASMFEFSRPRAFEGIMSAQPAPTLLVTRPGRVGELPGFSRYYLVGEGKFGVQTEAEKFNNQRVKLSGTLIYRDDQTMIELVPGSIAPISESTASAGGDSQVKALGTYTLQGEIVDSKCFLGVMNPGDLKTHKACAVRCIAGGSPAVFVVRHERGLVSYFMLLSGTGQTVNQDVLDVVARPLEITGEVWQYDNLLALRADPASYRLLEQ